MKLEIGAEEIILHLRKNGLKKGETNDFIGKWIRQIVEKELGGEIVGEDKPVLWPINDTVKVNEYNLPKTAAAYRIPLESIGRLYEIVHSETNK